MGRAIPIVIGEEYFTSKTEAEKRVRNLIGAYPFGDFLSGEDYSFCMKLFEYHTEYPKKIGSGVRAIQVRRDEQGQRYFHLHRIDESDVRISWKHCISPKKYITVVLGALRSAVKDQIQEAETNLILQGAVCPFYGCTLNYTNSHLDHFDPTFQLLVAMFLEFKCISLTDIRIEEQEGTDFRGLPADERLRAAWIAFHARHAKLRLISDKANLSDAKLLQSGL